MPAASWTAGRLVGFDLETTGLDREHDEPVAYAFATFTDGVRSSLEEGWLLPTSGRSISEGAARVHGLTEERLAQLGATRHEEGIEAIASRLAEESARGTPIVGANLPYDLTMVDRCLGRLASMSSLERSGWHGPALDVLVIDRALDTDFSARPVRKLEALCEHYGVTSALHTAGGDATAAVEILLAQADRFPSLAALTLDEAYERQRVWHAEWCDALSARRVAQGRSGLEPSEREWPLHVRATLW